MSIECICENVSLLWSSCFALFCTCALRNTFLHFSTWSLNRQIKKQKRRMLNLELNAGPPKHTITKQLLYLLCNGSFLDAPSPSKSVFSTRRFLWGFGSPFVSFWGLCPKPLVVTLQPSSSMGMGFLKPMFLPLSG